MINVKNKLIGIQLMRICACLGVFLVHLGQRLRFTGSIRTLTDFGAFGVELFFILSGYLAFYNSGGELKGDQILKYYLKRAIRILPLYYLATVIIYISETFVWQSISNSYGWFRELFISNGVVKLYEWKNPGGTWTIHIFVCFYLLVPILLKIIKSTKAAFVFFVVSYFVGHFTQQYANGWLDFLQFLPYFSMGILLCFAEKDKKDGIVSFMFGTLVLLSIIFSRREEMIYSFVFCILILAANRIEWPRCIARIANALDPYTYTLYLTHCLVICEVLDKCALPKVWAYIIGFSGSIALTVIIYHFYEKPIYIFLKNRVDKHFEKRTQE